MAHWESIREKLEHQLHTQRSVRACISHYFELRQRQERERSKHSAAPAAPKPPKPVFEAVATAGSRDAIAPCSGTRSRSPDTARLLVSLPLPGPKSVTTSGGQVANQSGPLRQDNGKPPAPAPDALTKPGAQNLNPPGPGTVPVHRLVYLTSDAHRLPVSAPQTQQSVTPGSMSSSRPPPDPLPTFPARNVYKCS